jgi:hypothetical protein
MSRELKFDVRVATRRRFVDDETKAFEASEEDER